VSDNKSKILILEDDESLGTALKEVLSRAGHYVYMASRPDEAMSLVGAHNVDFVFVDCLLPQMTGLDFVEKARQTYPSTKFKVILMSGIYSDKQFIQEALAKTQALSFLKKPFDLEQVLKLVKSDSAPRKEESSARKLLYQMFANPTVTNRQKRKVIESIEEVSGFDLPFLYSLLAETKSSGYLNIYNADGTVSGISFCNGNIVGVDVDDRTTFLGEMLIQSGYATPIDVQTALRDKNTRRIGNYLIQNNQLSPHAFDIILTEQMNIRLVRTIVDHKIRVNFAATEVDMSNPSIDADTLSFFLHDWIASKISVSWLKSLYTMWQGNLIGKSPTYRDDHPALGMSLVKNLEGFTGKLNEQVTLNQLLEVKDYSEVAVYKALHFLLTKGLIVFAQKTSYANVQDQMKALKKMWTNFEGKDTYEVAAYLESIVMAGGSGEAVMSEFMTLIGEQPSEREPLDLWHKLKNSAEEAVRVAKDSSKLEQMRQDSQRSEAEAKLRANNLMDEAKKSLQLNQFSRALTQLAEVSKLNPQSQHLHIYNSWAKMGGVDPAKKQFFVKDIELELLQVPPDERYEPVFLFVIGLFNKMKGDIMGAKKSFEKCMAMDPGFIPARREMSMLHQQNKKQDVFNMDLKQVVSGFFKRR
jgi:DNA-binding response OmpR family regulator